MDAGFHFETYVNLQIIVFLTTPGIPETYKVYNKYFITGKVALMNFYSVVAITANLAFMTRLFHKIDSATWIDFQ